VCGKPGGAGPYIYVCVSTPLLGSVGREGEEQGVAPFPPGPRSRVAGSQVRDKEK